MPTTNMKRPLMKGQFAWIVSKKDGQTKVIFGPDPLENTDDDLLVVPDPNNPTEVIVVEDPNDVIQNFIVLKPNEYAIVHSPTEHCQEGYPNGSVSKGRKDMAELCYGKKRVIIEGQFPLWPGQMVEIHERPHLSTSQFLKVVVEDENIDIEAPYYELTVKCAQIKTAVVDDTVDSGEEEDLKLSSKKDDSKADPANENPEDSENTSKGDDDQNSSKNSNSSETKASEDVYFQVGQQIIIPGSLTPTYIPPSGIAIIPDEGEEIEDNSEPGMDIERINFDNESSKAIRNYLKNLIDTGKLDRTLAIDIARKTDDADSIEHYVSRISEDYSENHSLYRAIENTFESGSSVRYFAQNVVDYLSRQKSASTKNISTTTGFIREAVVLGPTEFCVLLDEDGRPKTKQGPGRVFPGPFDRFRTEGSRNRIYDAYHLRNDRGLLLRVIDATISHKDLSSQLPSCFKLEEREYSRGDEIFISGHDAYVVPTNSIEVINPSTRIPHTGNDHNEIYVKAIGIDQKSGAYVADANTGNITLVKGEKKLLLDPRKERHVERKVPGGMWNLMVANGEPHKEVNSSSMVNTPWALSIIIPNNEAILITSKDNRRVALGPKTELLAYEEWLEVLQLSRGRPKSDDHRIPTCFLRVRGNRVTDQVVLETKDFIAIHVDIAMGVEFIGDSPEEQAKWFDYKDYIELLCNNVRSRLRAAAREHNFTEIYRNIADFIRDTILGQKRTRSEEPILGPTKQDDNENGGEEQSGVGHRPGLLFSENNMLVHEVEVLKQYVPSDHIDSSVVDANRNLVQLGIEVEIDEAKLEAEKKRHKIQEERNSLVTKNIQLEEKLAVEKSASQIRIETQRQEDEHKLKLKTQSDSQDLDKVRKQTQLMIQGLEGEITMMISQQNHANNKVKVAIDTERRNQLVTFRQALSEISIALNKAKSDANVAELKAVQPKLVEALQGISDKEVLTTLAENLPEAEGSLGFLLGNNGLESVKQMLGDQPRFNNLMTNLFGSTRDLEAKAESIEDTDQPNSDDPLEDQPEKE